MKDIIRLSKLFNNFTDIELGELEKQAPLTLRNYNKESYIFTEGEDPEYMFVLIGGGVQVEKIDINGKRIIVNVFKEPGTIFGEVYLYINQPYDYSCLVLEDSTVGLLPKAFFIGEEESLIQKKLTKNMLKVLSSKAFYLNQKLLILGSFTLRQKLSNYLLQKAREVEAGRIHLPFNREELADYIGTTRPSLSRELMSMEEDGLIIVEKDLIIIKDLQALEELS